MQLKHPLATGFAALGALSAVLMMSDGRAVAQEGGGQRPASKEVRMGDYEIVTPWPKPLPDSGGVTHAGWTWGSGGPAGVGCDPRRIAAQWRRADHQWRGNAGLWKVGPGRGIERRHGGKALADGARRKPVQEGAAG